MTQHQIKDIQLIGTFVEVYCSGRHAAAERSPFPMPAGLAERSLCPACAEFMAYAVARRQRCPLEADKPTCKKCRIHCYDASHRQRVREIMSYSGRRLMLRGRLDYLWHYFF